MSKGLTFAIHYDKEKGWPEGIWHEYKLDGEFISAFDGRQQFEEQRAKRMEQEFLEAVAEAYGVPA